MARTAVMRLLELMVMKEDIRRVIEYLGKKGNFEFQDGLGDGNSSASNAYKETFEQLQTIRSYLNVDEPVEYLDGTVLPGAAEITEAEKLCASVTSIRDRETKAADTLKRISDTLKETKAFANLKVPYTELEHLSFLTLRVGKIDPGYFDELVFRLGNRAVVVALGEDKSRILVASSKKGRFSVETELKDFNFVPLSVPKDFKGVPDDMIAGLERQEVEAKTALDAIVNERRNFAETHTAILLRLLCCFSIGMQVQLVEDKLESTQLVYRITGWIPAADTQLTMKELDNLTEGRIAIRLYAPEEVPSVINGREKVPVKLKHGKFVGSFERMVFSYGAPLYGTIDPTPIVAFFFTLLFGIMFGDAGQGLVFLLIGILLTTNVIKKFPSWNKFGPIFIAIGISSTVMGLLNGEFFANSELLIPFGEWLTGLFGEPRERVLELMPSADTIGKMFLFFLFTMAVGFIINSLGLIINIVNQFSLHHPGKALFGKTGLSGALFFWYVIAMVIRIVVAKSSIQWFDWIVIGVTLFGVFMAEPLERLLEGERPVFKDGVSTGIIVGLVEIMDTVSNYFSNTASFLRVGAFALAHVVLGFIIFSMSSLAGGAGGLLITVLGNVIVIVLEGMVVAIQVIRLQYYEFFSKFFTETGKEFKPFQFRYKE